MKTCHIGYFSNIEFIIVCDMMHYHYNVLYYER